MSEVVGSSSDREKDREISHLSLQIQLSATAVATSFLLIFIPNVETITFTAFLFGFLFPLPFAIMGIVLMTFTWEIFASMVFAFSGVVFPFKIIAWLLVGLIGRFAREIKARYFYEFTILGAISAVIFDLLVTIPTSFFFIGDQQAFLTVFISNLVVGLIFTISHTGSNALLFSFIPLILQAILPVLASNYEDIIEIPQDHFEYMDDHEDKIFTIDVLFLDKRRLMSYLFAGLCLVLLLGAGTYVAINPDQPDNTATGTTEIHVVMVIDYDGVKPNESHDLVISSNQTVFTTLRSIATVNYTTQYHNEPFVQAINGVWQNDQLSQHYWVFYINDEYVNSGANSTYMEDGDRVEWLYR